MWFDGTTAGWLGAILGSSIGILGGLFGAVAGTCISQGRCRWLVLGALKSMIGLGLLLLITGGVAFFTGQPYHVWYGFTLCGWILSLITPSFHIIAQEAYTASELKRMQISDMK